MPSILVHLQRVDVVPHPFLLWVGTHLALPPGDKDNCWHGTLAAGVEILLEVGERQWVGEVGKATGGGVRGIWGCRGRSAESGSSEEDCKGSWGDLHGSFWVEAAGDPPAVSESSAGILCSSDWPFIVRPVEGAPPQGEFPKQ